MLAGKPLSVVQMVIARLGKYNWSFNKEDQQERQLKLTLTGCSNSLNMKEEGW